MGWNANIGPDGKLLPKDQATPQDQSLLGYIGSSVGGATAKPLAGVADKVAGSLYPSAPEDLSKGPDVQAVRDFAGKLRGEYENRTPGVAQQVTAPTINTAQSDEARRIMGGNIASLEGVASGATPTAANALFTRGMDAARANAAGLAAAYSRSNPGLALRAGLHAGNQAAAEGNAAAAQLKAQEQAAARDRIGALAGAMRGADLGVATNQAGLEADAAARNQAAQQQQQQINNQYEIAKGGQVAGALLSPYQAALANQQLQEQRKQQNAQTTGSILTTLGGIISDERAKENVRTSNLADAMADEVRGVAFKYKPGHDDEGEHVGVIAQDLERAIPGVVKTRKDGLKVVDAGHLTMANTSTISELARRLRAVEARG